jgi:hypothetical protein
MLDSFIGAIDELGWRFQRAASAIGIRGQSIGDGGGNGGVWDEAASERAHWSKRGDAYRNAVQKMTKIDRTIAALSPAQCRVVAQVFEPYGRTSAKLANAFTLSVRRSEAADAVSKVPLIALVVETHAARVAFGKAHDTVVAPGTVILLRWLEHEAEKPGSSRTFEWMKREAAGRLQPALAAYEEFRLARVQEEIAAKRAHAAECTAQGNKIREERMSPRKEREQQRIERAHAGRLGAIPELLAAKAARDRAEKVDLEVIKGGAT